VMEKHSVPWSGFESVQGRRWNMEDSHVMIDNLAEQYPWLTKDSKFGFYAVFDGHGGRQAAIVAEHTLLAEIMSKQDVMRMPFPELLRKAFLKTEAEILRRSAAEKWSDGCTAAAVLLHNNKLYVANIGDSEVVLGRRKNISKTGAKEVETDWEAVLLSEKHVPSNPSEAERLSKLGCTVTAGRVSGVLAVSRSFGDAEFKASNNNGSDFVTAVPHIKVVDLTEQDEFLIVACDGLWDVLSYKDAVDNVASSRWNGRVPVQAAEYLVREALDRKTMDNVTCICVYLQ